MTIALIGLNALLLGGVVAWIALYFWREGRDLRAAGVEARATLIKKFRKSGNTLLSKIENCFVTAEFLDAKGRRWNVDIRVPSRQWHWLREGRVETIVYLPANPAR